MRSLSALIAGLLLCALFALPAQADVVDEDPFAGAFALQAADVPDEFVEETAFDGLVAPASIAFSPDGRVFVGQLDGEIKVFDGLDDPTGEVYADLSRNVMFNVDRGLMGMVLDPQFTTGRPYLYVSYTYDAAIGATAPRWNDFCPDPPGAERDGCVVSGRLSKILPDGSEQPLITNEWCQQYPSHSLGDLHFGPDGALYVSSGDGASYTFADYGQDGSPVNPCGDPPSPVGGSMTPPSAEGGALRSQDLRTSADPTGLDGTLLRIDPDTAEPLPDNPGTGDRNARRIVAYGFRNPFRFAFRPGTTDAYVGDVGWLAWEELNRVPDTTSRVRNYGWPCYEGDGRQGAYEATDLKICRDLYNEGPSAVVPPLYTYNHAAKVATESCPVGGSSISGMEFYDGTTFPVAYRGAMFFADYSRGCIWVMFPNADGTPNPATRQVFVDGAESPVDLEMGPGGDLYYAAVGAGEIRRIRAINPNQAPTAAFTASPSSGPAPLHVEFDASDSTDPNQDTLRYEWDLDGDGAYDDSTAVAPSRTYTAEGPVTVKLRVLDPSGLADTHETTLTVGAPPEATITGPDGSGRYAVGETVAFSGRATTSGGTPLPASALRWAMDLHHCSAIVATSCHVHHIQDFVGTESGSFSYPDHEYPSYISLSLTATAPSGLTDRETVRIDPKTVDITFNSVPSGLRVAVGGEASATPFTRTVAQGSTVGVAAAGSQFLAGHSYDFASWSDGGAPTHQFTAPATATARTVTYTETVCPVLPGLVGAWAFDETSGTVAFDASGRSNSGTISGATRVTSGRFGSALSFDGINDLVTVADSASLDLVSGMTLEAWVNPTVIGGSWRTIALKERPGDLAYALYGADDNNRPSGHVATPSDTRTTGPALPLNTWSHVAVTFDGSTLRMYEGGNQVSSTPVVGNITVSNGALRIGGNTVWSEWFTGLIDEVKLYDRALSQAELQADMARAIVCTSDPEAPVLSVSPASLSFTGEQGGASPVGQTIDIANTGAGPLQWSVSDDAAWLNVSPSSGTGAGAVTITANTSGLTAGTYVANVTVTAPGATGSPRIVPVSLTVTPPPQGPTLSVTPGTLTFSATEDGANPADRTLTVANTGGGTLSWTASDDAPWLSVAPASGTNGGAITVSASAAGLGAGTHTANVTVSAAGAGGSPRVIGVTFTIDPAPLPPALAVAPASLSFSAVEGAATVETKALNVTNSGGGTLDFTATADVPWLTLNPTEGSAPRTVSVTPRTAGLAPGVHTGTVTVAGPGGPKTVAVTFTVTAAPACAPPAGLVGAWGFDETSGTTTADASPAANTGTISGATRTTAGRFGRALSFDGAGDAVAVADATSLDLTTGMTLSAWVNPAALGDWRTVLLKESGGGLSYALYANTDTAQASAHVSTPLESNTKSPTALAVGVWSHLAATYDGSTLRLFVNGVQVSSRGVLGAIPAGTGALRIGGNAVWGEWYSGLIDEVRVYNRALGGTEIQTDMANPVTCSGPPAPAALAATPSTLSFQATQGAAAPAAKTIDVANTGGGQMNWTASESAAWLSLAPTSGTNAGTITVTPSITGLTAGTYTTDITVTAAGVAGSPRTIPVTLTVDPPPPVLSVTPATLAFSATAGGASPAAKSLAVTNTGGGTLSWSASETAAWLSVAPGSGTGAGTIDVTASVSGLAAGTYQADVTVSAAGAGGSPRTIPVTFTVDPAPVPPALSVTPASLSFSGTQGGGAPTARTLSVANTGGGSLDWEASTDTPWLEVSPATGANAGTITVTPSITGLTEGTYEGEIVVAAADASGSPKTIPVTFTVGPPAPPPALTIAPAALSFRATQGAANPASQNVAISNTGGGTLNFTVTDDAAWLSATPGSGSAPASLSVSAATGALAPGTYTATITVAAPGATGAPKTVAVTFIVDPGPATPPGLIAAYGFEEASGTTVADAAGVHTGTVAGATRSATGRFGRSLSFDGVNDWVTVPDTNTLDLTTGLTMSAWVNPAAVGSTWRTVLMKEQPGGLIYTLYAGEGNGRPGAHVFTTAELATSGTANTPLNAWTHLASTWDGTTLRLFINGTQVSSRAVSGTLRTSTGVLRIGGNGVWPEWFRGLIDEVRLYSRALTPAEIQGDMGRAVSG